MQSPRVRAREPGHTPQQRGLPRRTPPRDADDVSLRQLQLDARQHARDGGTTGDAGGVVLVESASGEEHERRERSGESWAVSPER